MAWSGLADPAGVDNVLPTTTRWKPQRDTTQPITVNFKGLSDLDTATVRLEVTPPAGFFGTYTPTKGVVTKVTGSDDEYTFDWTGPWTFEPSPGTTMPMPRGNYSLVVVGKRQNSDTEIRNETPFDKVSLVEVTEVALTSVPGAPSLSSNPEIPPRPSHERWGRPGGGLRIFPESVSATSTEVIDRVKVTATLNPPVDVPVTVFFRSFDVDDPLTDAPLIDSEGASDNCLRSSFTATCPTSPHGFFLNSGVPIPGETGISVPASGETAEAILLILRQQGDNYRVAASTHDAWLAGLRAPQRVTRGELEHVSGEAVLDAEASSGPQISPMITVWRTLHLEVDRLDGSGVQQYGSDPTGARVVLDVTGTISALSARRLVDSTAPFIVRTARPGPTIDHSRSGDWVGADLWPNHPPIPPDAPGIKVTASGADYVEVGSSADLTTLADVADTYRLSDDREVAFTGSLPLALTQTILRELYVELDASEALNPRPVRPFVRNLEVLIQQTLAGDLPNSAVFWGILLVEAFDPRAERDYDPDVTSPIPPDQVPALGTTVSRTRSGSEPVCAVFRETNRELTRTGSSPLPHSPATALEITVAHEILCHAMGQVGVHETPPEEFAAVFTLCRPYSPGVSEGFDDMSEEQRSKLRRLSMPQLRRIR